MGILSDGTGQIKSRRSWRMATPDRPQRLLGKVAIVTGGSGGIGSAIALGLAREGAATVVGFHRDRPRAEAVVTGIREQTGAEVAAISADLSSPSDAESLVREAAASFGGLDILVNAAGRAHFVDFFDITSQAWDEQFDVNAKGLFIVSQAAARVMKESGGGRIINVTSISGDRADPDLVAYCASKGAANMLTKAMAVALAPYNITVNAVLPGTTLTDMNRQRLGDGILAERVSSMTPLKRLGAPIDHVGAVVYFASAEASWTTGAMLTVDGGFTA
jgi:NAD(P)-dependent dehydrogenase (short-subunit alcohol dehydrogenase family)